MYTKLVYNADAANTSTQLLDHITQLLTGTSVVGDLTGGNIDTTASEIDTSYQAVNYTLYDDISTTRKVFQIPVHDDAAQFFYMELVVSGNDIDIKLWDSWDNVNSTGTSGAYYSSSNFEFASIVSAGSAATYHFSVTSRHCIARSPTTSKEFRGFIQFDRAELWDTPANGFKPVALLYSNSLFTTSGKVYLIKYKRSNGSTYTGSSAYLYAATRYGNSKYDNFTTLLGNSASSARGLDANNNFIHNFYEFGFSYTDTGSRFITGKVHDLYVTTYGNGAFGDIVSYLGNIYMIWTVNTNYRVAIRLG